MITVQWHFFVYLIAVLVLVIRAIKYTNNDDPFGAGFAFCMLGVVAITIFYGGFYWW